MTPRRSFTRRSRTWLVCAVIALLTACGRGDPQQLVASAKDYLAKKDYAAASIQLKNALQQDPRHAEARYLLGVSLLESGDPVSAEKEFRRALEHKYRPAAVVPELAKTLARQGQYQKLVDELGATTLDDPAPHAALKTEIGLAYLALNRPQEAGEAYAAALAARPGDPKGRVGQARIMALGKDLAGAMTIADEVLAQSPAQSDALALKAELELAQNALEPAKETLAKLIQAQPDNGSARFQLVSMLINDRKFDGARTELDAMKKAVPRDVRSRYLEALLTFRQGNAAKAREAILEMLRAAPDHAPSQLLAGAIELQLGSFGTAEDYLRRVVARHPQNTLARKLLAQTLLRLGQPARAEEVLEPVLKLAPDDTEALQFAGEAAAASGDFPRASRYYQQAAARDKDNARLRTRLAQVRYATGDVDQALKDLESASTIDSGQYQADIALILSHVNRKDWDKALAAVATLEKKQPANPLTFNIKGAVQFLKGDRATARATFEKALELQFDYVPAARNLARMDLAEKQPDAARRRFESILAKAPGNEGALTGLADLLAATGAPPKEVAATRERAVAANPASVTARLALIEYYGQRGDAKSALAAAQAANVALPNDIRVREALGRAQLAAGDTNQAITTFQAVVAALPQSIGALQRLAAAQLTAKEYDNAIGTLRKALAIRSDAVEVRREIAIVQVAAGRPEEALKEARAVQAARPKDAMGFALEGDIFTAQKKLNEAISAYGEALKRQPSAPTLVIRLHALFEAAGKVGEGDSMAARWLRDNPKDTGVRLYLAERDLKRKDYKAASKGYRELLAIQPENAIILNNLAWTLSQLNDPSALGFAEQAYGLAPNSPAIADTLGWILVERGDTQRGVEILAKAAAGAPNALEVRIHYAKALVKAGDKPAARKELESALKAVAGQASPMKAEAEALLKQL